MSKTLAKIISTIFGPLFVCPAVLLVIAVQYTHSIYEAYFWVIVLGALLLIPVASFLLYLIFTKQITDINISIRENRDNFYVFGLIVTLITASIMYAFNAPTELLLGVFSVFGVNAINALVNELTKISLHTASLATGATLTFLLLSPTIGILGLLLTVVMIYCRILLKYHTFLQAALGALNGIITTYLIFAYLGY
ncbi:MAG: hypothetical protein ACOZAO_01155 [Patescibacteria group bacterium]